MPTPVPSSVAVGERPRRRSVCPGPDGRCRVPGPLQRSDPRDLPLSQPNAESDWTTTPTAQGRAETCTKVRRMPPALACHKCAGPGQLSCLQPLGPRECAHTRRYLCESLASRRG